MCNSDLKMMKHTSNRLNIKNNNRLKRTSKSIVNIWSKLKKSKRKKKLSDGGVSLDTRSNNVKANMTGRLTPNTSIITNRTEEIIKSENPQSNTINDEINLHHIDIISNKFHGKYCDNTIPNREYKLPDAIEYSCQSDSRLINQIPSVSPKKLVKRSKIPRRYKKNYSKPYISQYYMRSVQSLKKPITEFPPEKESTADDDMAIEELPCENVQVELSVDTKKIPDNAELSLISHRSTTNISCSSIVSNCPEFQSHLLELNRNRILKKNLSEDSTDKRSDWTETETSDIDASPSIQQKIFFDAPFRESTSLTKSNSNFTEKYEFLDVLLDIICWPLLFNTQKK